MKNRLLKTTAFLLIQAFLVMDISWAGAVREFLEESTLAVKVQINDRKFQSAYLRLVGGAAALNFPLRHTAKGRKKINQLLDKIEVYTGIRDGKFIGELEVLLYSSINTANKEKIARKIIEEVLGEENAQLRLKALEIIIPTIISNIKPGRPSEGQIDLHTHTYLSDAYATPAAWVLQAYEQEGLAGMAITDHDIFPGQEALRAMEIINQEIKKQNQIDNAKRPGFQLIPGVEVATLNNGVEVHVLLYVPDYYRESVIEEKEIKAFLDKLKASKKKTTERIENILMRIIRKYPDFYLSEEHIKEVVRGPNIYASAIGDAIWKKYKDKFPDRFKELGISSEKDVWYNLIAKEGFHKRTKEHEELLPTLEDVAELAGKLKGRIAVAHPNEIMKQKEGAFEEVLERLANCIIERNISPSVILGISYYSHKLRRSGRRDDVKNYITWLNKKHPFYKRFNLLFIPESDAHGRYTLSNNPLLSSPLGTQSDYPEDKTAYNKELLAAIYDRPFFSLTSEVLFEIREDYNSWGLKTIRELKNGIFIDKISKLRQIEEAIQQAI